MKTINTIGLAGLVGLCALLGASNVHARGKRAGIRIQVDRRVELISILWRLAGAKEYLRAPAGPYVKAVDAHFGKYADHPAVAAVRELRSKHSISFNAPVALAVHLDPKTLKPRVPLSPFPDRLDSRWRNAPTADFLEKVRAFSKDTDFDGFFAKQGKYVNAVAGRYRKALKRRDPLAWCQAFFGPKAKVQVLVTPGLLCGPNGYGTSVLLPGGAEELRPILGVARVDAKGLPVLTDPRSLAGFLQHEIAHAYVNPAVDANAAALEAAGRRLWQPVAEAMKQQAYDNWKVTLYETLVRASTVLYLKDRFGEPAAASAQAAHRGRSFLWIAEVVQAMDRYRKQDRPPRDFAAFLPKLVPVLDAWASKPADQRVGIFPGPINAVYTPAYRAPGRMLLVGPGPVKTVAGQALAAYVKSIHASFYAKQGVPLRAASEVSADEARTQGLVIYGTPAGNPILKKLIKRLGWRVGPKAIRVGKRTFKGRDLVLVACHPHPDDAQRPVLIYAAARQDLLPGINGLFHGPTDWIVAHRTAPGKFVEVAKGDFPKSLGGSWRQLSK